MKPEDLSENALKFWFCHFLHGKSTLRFGGEGAAMEITKEARAALDELIAIGAAEAISPDCQRKGREHYGSKGMDLSELIQLKAEGEQDVFEWLLQEPFITFSKIEDSDTPAHSKIEFGASNPTPQGE